MATENKTLAQLRPNTTTTVPLYTTPTGVTTTIRSIRVCNRHSANAEFSLFYDPVGTNWGDDNVIFFEFVVERKTSVNLLTPGEVWFMDKASNGTIGVKLKTSGLLVFHVFGTEES